MRLSIRYQVLIPLLALMLGIVGASIWSAWTSGQRAREQIEKQIRDIEATMTAVPFALNTQILHLMKGLSGAEFLLCDHHLEPIRDDDGKLLATIDEAPRSLPPPSESAPGEVRQYNRLVEIRGTTYLCDGLPLKHPARPGAVLYILYPESLMREAVWQALRPALTVGIVGGLVSVALSVLLAQFLSSRIHDLERRTRLIAGGDFSPMPLPRLDDELRDLGRSVNEMAQRLAQFQETVRQSERLRLLGQVSGGLAHQLRNAAAGARLAVQLHAQDCHAPGDVESLNVALRQLSLVEMHLKKFLDLGTARDLQFGHCRLDEILRDATDLLGPQCRHAKIDLRLVGPSPPIEPMLADATQLGQLFLNVLTNAIEAAGPNGWVEVRWGSGEADRMYVEIRDSGVGPPPGVAERLFEPFVTGKREGVGLGLAVAKQVAEAHSGTIRFFRDGGVTCFRIELPIKPSDRDGVNPLTIDK